MEYSSQAEIEFLEIITETGNITLTGSHNVFYFKDGKPTPTYAENLRPGNLIVSGSGMVNKMHALYKKPDTWEWYPMRF